MVAFEQLEVATFDVIQLLTVKIYFSWYYFMMKHSVQCPEPSIQHPESSVQNPALRVRSPEFSVQSPGSRFQHPQSSVQSPELASNTCFQSLGIPLCVDRDRAQTNPTFHPKFLNHVGWNAKWNVGWFFTFLHIYPTSAGQHSWNSSCIHS